MPPRKNHRSRRIEKARQLLSSGMPRNSGVWADFGCGDGIFTTALFTLLPAGSTIIAVDQRQSALENLSRNFSEIYPEAQIQILNADYRASMNLPPLDGFIMANTLHFSPDHGPLLQGLVSYLKPAGRMILIEYNTKRDNYAVPYPLDDAQFLALTASIGLTYPKILAKIPSTFLGEMFSGIAFSPLPSTQE